MSQKERDAFVAGVVWAITRRNPETADTEAEASLRYSDAPKPEAAPVLCLCTLDADGPHFNGCPLHGGVIRGAAPVAKTFADIPLPISGKTARELATDELKADDCTRPTVAKTRRSVCMGCGDQRPFDSYETRMIDGKGLFHWDEDSQEWCGPVEEVSEGGEG